MKTILLAALFTMSTTISQLPVIQLSSLDGTEQAWVQKDGIDYQLSLENISLYKGCDVHCAELVIPTAQVLTLNGTPLTLVAAPGAGYAIELTEVSLKMVFNSVAYATNTTVQVIANGATAYQAQFNSAVLASASSTWNTIAKQALSGTNIIENTALQVKVATGNPTAGDSDIKIYLQYRIITL